MINTFWVFPLVLGYVALWSHSRLVFAAYPSQKDDSQMEDKWNSNTTEQLCADCRLTSNSLEDLIRNPRQMNAYGEFDDRIDLEKIKKSVCRNILKDDERIRCKQFYQNNVATIEKWKKLSPRTNPFDFICIKDLKCCCPRGSYGPRCVKCSKCNENETCHGEGTRSGNGSCICKEGYTGPKCEICSKGFYLKTTHRENKEASSARFVCERCHKSCKFCRREGSLGCEVCQSGYSWIPTFGCSDVDECSTTKGKVCGKNTFCVNTEGSYFCYGQ